MDKQGSDRDRDDRHDGDAPGIAAMVDRTERASGVVLIGIMATCIGLPFLSGIVRGHPVIGIANAILLGLVGWGLALLIHAIILTPLGAVRYGRAAKTLARAVRQGAEAIALHRSWSDTTPGAVTVSAGGRLWLADRSTGYRVAVLDRTDIHAVEAVTDWAEQGRASRPIGFGIGVPLGGGLLMTIARAPKVRAPKLRVSHAVVMRYAASGDPAIRVARIPFGPDHEGARTMAALLGGTSAGR